MRAASAMALALILAACGSDENSDSEEENGGETYSEYDERRENYDGKRGSFAAMLSPFSDKSYRDEPP